LNLALAYIEERLDGEIDLEEVARRAGCSSYHFSRTFSFLAGIPLSEYIRRRRMTLAAGELRTGGVRVIDLAVKYGYTSADAFSRAFTAVHGVTPSQSREAALKAYPRMIFQLAIQGGDEMNYRMVSKDAFRIIGVHRRVKLVYEGINPEIAAMFRELGEDTIATLKSLSNTEPRGLIQGTTDFSEDRGEGSSLDHYIGAASTLDCPEGFTALEVPAGEWAVFPTEGPFPQTMQAVWARIFTEWFPSSGYQHAGGPELVWSEHRDITSPTFRNEIWIPVRPVG
jgi:AraC family transcriptional regulator